MSESNSESEPFERIQSVDAVLSDVREMSDNIENLKDQLRTLEWQLLGGRGDYAPERCQKICEGTARGVETIAEEIANLPNPYSGADDSEPTENTMSFQNAGELKQIIGEELSTVDVGVDGDSADSVTLLAEEEVFTSDISGRYVLVALPDVVRSAGGEQSD